MNFNSIEFLFFFFPSFLLLYFIFEKIVFLKNFNLIIIIFFSCLFYIYFDFKYFVILIISIVMNYILSTYYSSTKKKYVLFLSIFLNLSPLIYFKYSVDLINFFHKDFVLSQVILPLGISFLTFQQLSYHFDIYQDKKKS